MNDFFNPTDFDTLEMGVKLAGLPEPLAANIRFQAAQAANAKLKKSHENMSGNPTQFFNASQLKLLVEANGVYRGASWDEHDTQVLAEVLNRELDAGFGNEYSIVMFWKERLEEERKRVAEIERLRAENGALVARAEDQLGHLERVARNLTAERDRVREALEWYASGSRPADEYAADCGERAREALYGAAARAALGGK